MAQIPSTFCGVIIKDNSSGLYIFPGSSAFPESSIIVKLHEGLKNLTLTSSGILLAG